MRITIIAWGGQGDVRPLVALGRGFKAAGHTVRIAANKGFEALVKRCGLDYWPMEGDPEQLLQAQDFQAAVERSSGIAAFRSTMRVLPRLIRQWMIDGHAACQDTDVVMGGIVPMFYVGPALAEKNNVPFVPCYLQPLTPTRAFPSFGLFTGTNTETTMRRRAAELGEKIRAEDGVARAVEIVERTCGN